MITRNPQLRRLSDFVTIEVDEWFGDETLTYDVNGGVLNYNSPELIWGYGDKRISEILFQLPDIFTYPGSSPIFSVSDKFLAHSSYSAELVKAIVTDITLHADKSVTLTLKNGQQVRKEQSDGAHEHSA